MDPRSLTRDFREFLRSLNDHVVPRDFMALTLSP